MMRKFTGCVVLVLGIMLGGCAAFLAFQQPPDEEDIPTALAFVIANEKMFTPSGDDPLADIAPGTVIDDLNELDGCWGISQPEPSAEVPVDLHLVYIFDRENGEYASWSLRKVSLQEVFFGSVTMMFGDSGVFSVEGDNRIVVTTTTKFSYWAETRSFDERDATGASPFEWLATLSGDRLKVRFDAANDEEDQREDNIATFRRFDCPE